MSFRIRRPIKATAGGRFGTSSSYVNFAVDGRQTMVGAARVYKEQWVPAPAFFLYSASTASGLYFDAGSMALVSKYINFNAEAASVFSGSSAASLVIPVMTNAAASPSTASMVFATAVVPKPLDADTTGCINVRQVWSVLDDRLTANSSMAFKIAGAYVATGACIRTAACTGAAGSYPATSPSRFIETSLGNLPSWGANDISMIVNAGMDWASASTSNGSGFAIVGYKFRYVANTLGTQVT